MAASHWSSWIKLCLSLNISTKCARGEVDCCLSLEQEPEGEGGGGSVPTHMSEWRNSSSTKLAPLLFCILVNRMASNCTNRVKYVDDATVMEFVPRLSPSYLNFTVPDSYSLLPLGEWFLMVKNARKCALVFCSIARFPQPLYWLVAL